MANYHWVLVAYDIRNSRIIGYDPLMKTMPDELRNVERILGDGHVIQGPVEHVNGTDVPGQTDAISCGPAIITYMLALMREALPLPPRTAPTVRLIRRYIACALLANTLGDPVGRNAVRAEKHASQNSPPRFMPRLYEQVRIPSCCTPDEMRAEVPKLSDVASLESSSGRWIFGYSPDNRGPRPRNFNTFENLRPEDALTFSAGMPI